MQPMLYSMRYMILVIEMIRNLGEHLRESNKKSVLRIYYESWPFIAEMCKAGLNPSIHSGWRTFAVLKQVQHSSIWSIFISHIVEHNREKCCNKGFCVPNIFRTLVAAEKHNPFWNPNSRREK